MTHEENKRKVAELLRVNPKLKNWIEQTQLFSFIKAHWDDPHLLSIQMPDMTLTLNGTPVNEAEDLPLELIAQFIINSPFGEKDQQKWIQ